ncbi:polysaccharide biosynthesis tyrosine autokinase [Clostridium tyrobutyricum]|uniref:polysaccharide biosynthesis tyrosine autokinase n=1 Tax=Clostridium tyrobutyricum TaxID=1519 RepID=UPI0018A92512|nr:polysaccharide biosynthesis tyrosine autokinase [Clostridium tyrobutyricum]
MEEDTLDLKDLFNVLCRKKWIVIGITLIFIIFGFICGFLSSKSDNVSVKDNTNLYVSKASIMVANFPDDKSENIKGQTLLNQQIVRTYGAVASSREVAEDVVDKLKLNTKVNDFMNNVKVNVDDKIQLITLTYGDDDPSNVKKIISIYMKTFMDKSKKIYPYAVLKVIDNPSNPYEISKSDFDKIDSSDQNSQPQQSGNKAVSFKSKKLITLVSVFLGLIFGLGVALFLEYIDDSFRKREEAEKIYSISTLGESMSFDRKNKVISEESYNILRTAVQFNDKNGNVFVITSPEAGDGKTETSIGLAKSFASAGFRTLIIDGNGRHPALQKSFNIDVSDGIADMMENIINIGENIGQVDFKKYIINTNNDNLYLLQWGNKLEHNPSDLFLKAHINLIIEKLREQYDYIVIDTPDILHYSDGQILLKACGKGIIVSSQYKTNRQDAEKLKNTLLNINAKPLGLFWKNYIS